MPVLKWDQVGDRVFERGVERGVLYLPDNSAVPWNGLTAVSEQTDKSSEAVYYDGQKINDLVTVGDFVGTLQAITYPDEFLELEGYGLMSSGIYVGDQNPQTFGLSYRTKVGSDLDPDSTEYKLHVLYNITAIPSDKNFETLTNDVALTEFEWTISAVPEEVPGFRPSAHIVLDSRTTDPTLLSDIELALYGGVTANAQLPAFADLIEIILGYFIVEIIDNKNGTWTAITDLPGYILMLSLDQFQLNNVNATYLDADTYQISDTKP